jgi:hypothetical protein
MFAIKEQPFRVDGNKDGHLAVLENVKSSCKGLSDEQLASCCLTLQAFEYSSNDCEQGWI